MSRKQVTITLNSGINRLLNNCSNISHMKPIYFLAIIMLLTLSGYTQETNMAIGIRGGLSSGFEYRAFSEDLRSYKVLLSTREQGLQLTGLKEYHVPDVFNIKEDFSFIYGFGVHAGFESWYVYEPDVYFPATQIRIKKTGPIAGLDALAALEYTIPQIPFVVGIEVKPYFNVFGKNLVQFQLFDFAFTVKYTF